MSIKFLNLDKTLPVEKIRSTRPTGYKFPIGLGSRLISFEVNAATVATGGTQIIDGDNTVHTFTTSGFFEPNFIGNGEYLIVAAGAAGGTGDGTGGGGGAGGLIYGSDYSFSPTSNVVIIVGAGGSGQISGRGSNGTNSSIGTTGVPSSNVEATGGGGGGGGPGVYMGFSGGSGGGAGCTRDSVIRSGNSGTPGQGYPGGNSRHIDNSFEASGGGGGAGGAGANFTSPGIGGRGGYGLFYSISGANTGYAGGGAGNGNAGSPAHNPIYGGGIGPSAGVANRGGGGGGRLNASGIAGGSGIVILRFATTQGENEAEYSIN